MSGRGLLGKWGPNHAADPIVTRYDPGRPNRLQMVAIKRKDTGEWAIPGGMVDAGEVVSATVRREFEEEVGNLHDEKLRSKFKKLTDELFASGEIVYRGYVDDPRNTDQAWMETTAFHFHCSNELGKLLPLESGDDAAAVMWLAVDSDEPRYANLYASHKEWVDSILKTMRGVSSGLSASVGSVGSEVLDEADAPALAPALAPACGGAEQHSRQLGRRHSAMI